MKRISVRLLEEEPGCIAGASSFVSQSGTAPAAMGYQRTPLASARLALHCCILKLEPLHSGNLSSKKPAQASAIWAASAPASASPPSPARGAASSREQRPARPVRPSLAFRRKKQRRVRKKEDQQEHTRKRTEISSPGVALVAPLSHPTPRQERGSQWCYTHTRRERARL